MTTPTTAEGALSALFAALGASLPAGAKLLRNGILPERVPPQGVAILRDGDPGEPEVLLSPPRYIYEHRAEIDIAVEAASAAERDAAFDALKRAIGARYRRPHAWWALRPALVGESTNLGQPPIEGAEGLKAATIASLVLNTRDDRPAAWTACSCSLPQPRR